MAHNRGPCALTICNWSAKAHLGFQGLLLIVYYTHMPLAPHSTLVQVSALVRPQKCQISPLVPFTAILKTWSDTQRRLICSNFCKIIEYMTNTWRRQWKTPHSCAEIFQFLLSCNQWKTSFHSHIVEQHKSYRVVMGIHPGEQKHHFLHEALFQVLANSMHKTVHHWAHGCLQVLELEREEK